MQYSTVERARALAGCGPRPGVEFQPQRLLTEMVTGQVRNWWSPAVIHEVASLPVPEGYSKA